VVRKLQLKHEDRCSNGRILPRHFFSALPPRDGKISSQEFCVKNLSYH